MEKIVLGIAIILLFSTGIVYGQELKLGDPAIQKVKVTVSENGDVHIVHEVKNSKNLQQVAFISNNFTNLHVSDKEGNKPEYAETNAKNVGLALFPTKEDVIVEYDVKGTVMKKDGLWTLDYEYLADTIFYLPKEIKLIYINNSILNLENKNGIFCHGCKAKIEYESTPTEITKTVQWEEKKFDVKIITLAKISSLNLDQPNKKISFDVKENNKYITLIIPKELLGNPYQVLLNGEPILKQERAIDNDSVLLHIKPAQMGTIEIVGVSVVPEFPLVTTLVLSVAMFTIIFSKRFNLH